MGKKISIKNLNPFWKSRVIDYSAFSEFQNLLCNVVKISNVDFVTESTIKKYLLDGCVGYDKLRDVWCNVYGTGINKQGNPTNLIFVYENGETFTRPAYYNPDDYGAYLIKATPLPFSFNDMIKFTSDTMRECDISINQNIKASRIPFIAILRDENLKLSLESAIAQQQDGKPVIVVSPELGEAMQGESVSTNYIVDKLAQFKYDERDRLLNKIGILTSNTDKKERVQVGEVNATINQCTDYIYLLIDTFNRQMESYELPFRMSFNGSLEDLYEKQISNEKKCDEKEAEINGN